MISFTLYKISKVGLVDCLIFIVNIIIGCQTFQPSTRYEYYKYSKSSLALDIARFLFVFILPFYVYLTVVSIRICLMTNTAI